MPKKLRFRKFNKFYAWLFGYFWLPCPLCGKYFGGHECGYAVVYVDEHSGYTCCKEHDVKESKFA